MLKTMVRFNALDITDKNILDEYAIITECDLYTAFYKNDFKWNQVRQAILKSVKNGVALFPTSYYFDTTVKLDRYDFENKIFLFAKSTSLNNINAFSLYSVKGDVCGSSAIKYVPKEYKAVLDAPVVLNGLALSEKDAKELLKRMEKDKNTERAIFARFNVSIVYIDALRKSITTSKGDSPSKIQYEQTGKGTSKTSVRMDARLDSIQFYADPEMTQLIFQYAGS